MGTTLLALTLQTFLEFKNKTKRKRVIESIIFFVGLITIVVTFSSQKEENKTHIKEINDQKERFSRLDSVNIVLTSELKLRNKDLEIIKIQNDSLKSVLLNVGQTQNKVIEVTKNSNQEISKSRDAIENANKQTARSISESERIKMINILKKYKNSRISLYSIQDREAIKFKSLIKEIFETAGWRVFDEGVFTITNPIEGVQIWVNNLKKTPIRVSNVIQAINVLKMSSSLGTFELEPDDVMLLIGSKNYSSN